jgi:hypothetical protein
MGLVYLGRALRLWRALRRLEATPRLLAPWPHPFPTTQLQHVTNNLRQAKPQ